jgi:hypothetical protein
VQQNNFSDFEEEEEEDEDSEEQLHDQMLQKAIQESGRFHSHSTIINNFIALEAKQQEEENKEEEKESKKEKFRANQLSANPPFDFRPEYNLLQNS